MGISTEQWRARVGGWAGRGFPSPRRAPSKCSGSEWPLAALYVAAVIAVILVIGGVEMNPGPVSNDEIADVLSGMRDSITNELKSINLNITNLGHEIKEAREHRTDLDNRLIHLADKVDYIENQSRRNNIVFYGIEERDGWESWEVSERLVLEVLQMMDISIGNMEIDRAHRVGKRKGRRPIVARFAFFKRREEILRGGRKLHNTGLAVSEDFSDRVRYVRFQLKPHLEKARTEGHQATLRYDKLVVDGMAYSLEELCAREERLRQDAEKTQCNRPREELPTEIEQVRVSQDTTSKELQNNYARTSGAEKTSTGVNITPLVYDECNNKSQTADVQKSYQSTAINVQRRLADKQTLYSSTLMSAGRPPAERRAVAAGNKSSTPGNKPEPRLKGNGLGYNLRRNSIINK